MANEALATYLNDHLAGSVIALEMLAHLAGDRAGKPDAPVLATLSADISADRDALAQLMTRLRITVSKPRQATAWITEKLGELKLRIDAPDRGALQRLEGLEMLSLGIEGKQSLWQALASVSDRIPELRGIDYDRLMTRAQEQREVVERMRLDAAREAFGAPD